MQNVDVDFSDVDISEEDVEEEEEYLNPLENDSYVILYEKHQWEKVKEVLAFLPNIEDGEYLLLFEMLEAKTKNIAFANVMVGYLFDKYGDENLNIACNVTESKDDQNHFWLLQRK